MKENENEKIDDISPEEAERAAEYKQGLDYEGLLTRQVSRICFYRAGQYRNYVDAVDALIPILMKDIRAQVIKKKEQLGIFPSREYGSYGQDVVEKYDALFTYINTILEDNNLIFKKAGFQRSKF